MTRFLDRRKVINLRKIGKTYSEIKDQTKIPKSTLSDWLRDLTLSDKELFNLSSSIKRNKTLAIEKTRKTKELKRKIRLEEIYSKEKNSWIPLNNRELELAGLFLYWGEGNKNLKSSLSINNTAPLVLKFSLYWLTTILKVPKNKIKVYLHLYNDMDKETEIRYWSNALKLPLNQFARPYIKDSKRRTIDHIGFGHGTCGLSVGDVRLKERIILGIKAIGENYSENL